MKNLDWWELKRLKHVRAASGHSSARISNLTKQKTSELSKLGVRFEGMDDLLYRLVDAEIERRKKTK